MSSEIYEWLLLLVRWLHITVAVTWIGTSIFFMWLDRSFVFNSESKNPGHVGDVWMVHGGGFYHVEKLLMGPTKVPNELHWFKWEAYWTWMSGVILIAMIFYVGDGSYLLDPMVSSISFSNAVILSVFSIIGSWIFYDFLWERKFIRFNPLYGHILTLLWFSGMSYYLCHTLSGRAAYIHIGAMLGTWMTANVFMRIIPRQILMVKASKEGKEVNQEWGKNAKNRSTHNTYFTLPVIFIMLSNHFPQTYGHEKNWLILLLISFAGATIREYFVVRLKNPKRSYLFAALGVITILMVMFSFQENKALDDSSVTHQHLEPETKSEIVKPVDMSSQKLKTLKGQVFLKGIVPEKKELVLPQVCAKTYAGKAYSNEVIVNDQKQIQNVLVRVIKGHEILPRGEVPKSIVELDQRGCLYKPRLVAVRVGQTLEFINSDEIFHNVRSVTTQNQKFNMAMPKKDQRIKKVFDKEEFFMQAKCSVHPWMGAYIAIIDHPYFSISNEEGRFEIKNLPPGQYTLEFWHEVFGRVEKDVLVEVEKNDELKIQLGE